MKVRTQVDIVLEMYEPHTDVQRQLIKDAKCEHDALLAERDVLREVVKLADAMQTETCEACGAVYPVCQEHITCRTTFAYRAARAKVTP